MKLHLLHPTWPDLPGRPLTEAEKAFYAPYVPQRALEAARLFEGRVPFWLRPDMSAVTLYERIYFRPGACDLRTPAGVALLGHELVHVAQYQDGMTVPRYLWACRRGYWRNPYEVEAYAAGADMRARCRKPGATLPG